jgi:hypothetical protein
MNQAIRYFGILAAALVATLSSLGADRPASAAADPSIAVKEVTGYAEFNDTKSGWKKLQPGVKLAAGASVRTGSDGKIILAMNESFVRIGPLSHVELSKSTSRPPAGSTEPAKEKIVPVIHKGSYSFAALQ